MPHARYKHIFFDLDHTLWDFETNSEETLRDLYHELELNMAGIPDFATFHQTYQRYNLMMWDRFRKGYINREELRWKRMWRTLLDFRIMNEPLARQISERYLEVLPTKKNLFEDTLDILHYLRDQQYPIHLITNGFEKTQHLKLQNSGIDIFFTHVVTSENAGIMKPHRAIFEYALQRAGTLPQYSIMIGDTLDVDIEGALQAGIDSVYYCPADVVAPGAIQPTYTIRRLSELRGIL